MQNYKKKKNENKNKYSSWVKQNHKRYNKKYPAVIYNDIHTASTEIKDLIQIFYAKPKSGCLRLQKSQQSTLSHAIHSYVLNTITQPVFW